MPVPDLEKRKLRLSKEQSESLVSVMKSAAAGIAMAITINKVFNDHVWKNMNWD